MTHYPEEPDWTKRSGMPEDIELSEAGRNWVSRRCAREPQRPIRQMAADAAVMSAIGQVFEIG